MISIQGRGVSSGVAMGPLYYYQRAGNVVNRVKVEDVEAEWRRFVAARGKAVDQLGELAEKARGEVGDEAATLFETHRWMAEDPDFEEAVEGLIKEGRLNAEAAVADAASRLEDALARADDAYMQARAADVKDVSGRIIGILTGAARGGIDSPVPVILASDELSPSEVVQLDRSKILGFIIEGGSGSGHTAILARDMGVPAVIGMGDRLKPEYGGREVIVDGSTGAVIVDADAAARAAMIASRAARLARRRRLEALKGRENVTRDGREVKVLCNIDGPGDVPAVLSNDGGGVGLFRSEYLFLSRPDGPSEDCQFEVYKRVLSDMGGREVVIRTLDIGGDKRIDHFSMPVVESRAPRVCLNRPEILKTQLRALYRASAFGRLGILFPMVTGVWEVREARKLCEQVRRELAGEGRPFADDVRIGIMIETPAAAVMSDRLAGLADFFSCGTNDLTQYTLACDRQSGDPGRFFDPRHPAVLRLLKMVCDNAHSRGVPVGICGELGADLDLTETFLSIGIDALSVSPGCVLPLRRRIREITLADVREKILADLLGDGEAECKSAPAG